jgi:hypothetical protein
MKNIYSRILYVILFCLGWIGILWSIWTFSSRSYQGEIEILMEDPSFFSNLCVSLMSIAMAVLLERTSKEKTGH